MKKIVLRGAAAAAVAGTAIAGLASGAANADTFIPLPSGQVTQRIGDGAIVVSATGQSAKLSPGMVALPTTRNAWVSGTLRATIKGKKPGNGSISAGYVVGCQISVGDTNITGSGTGTGPIISASSAGVGQGKSDQIASASVGTGASLKLAAGTIGTQPLTLDKPKWPNAGDEFKPTNGSDLGWQKPSKSFKFTGDSGSLSWSDSTIGTDGCAGYAQARFYAYVTGQVGNSEGTAVLWGKPFTLG
ncbi:MspA family porin [Tsukamurella sp. 8F]|uniref:MspA family porin n=1 Tax=unclassified Tsukamurella TaxID=2633480 RepID=UPI0023B9A18F|nr:MULTISPECIES: MspA family porin [unclassified Tsukamurella]MDF0532602.1 MspA family porin [Tsukamurella sp. 8J]MDF0589388.1 MspA family porin [Tsukamurella sp. 8F]